MYFIYYLFIGVVFAGFYSFIEKDDIEGCFYMVFIWPVCLAFSFGRLLAICLKNLNK